MVFNGSWPDFDLTGGGLAFALARALFVSGLFPGYGTLVFLAWVAPRASGELAPEARSSITRQLGRLARNSLAFAFAPAFVWLALEAGDMAGAGDLHGLARAIPDLLLHASFGHVLALQMLALAGCLTCLRFRPGRLGRSAALGFALVATALQAGHSHALAMDKGPSLLLFSDAIHLLSGGAWLGSLLPLLLFVRGTSIAAAASAARAFSPLGMVCVAGILVSAGFQGWELIGGVPGLIGTAYGWTAIAKIVLLFILLGFAFANRFTFAPALQGQDADAARRKLRRSIALEAGFGFLVVIAAGILTSLPPAIHEQPVWPFAWKPSLTTVQEDPEFRREVERALAMLTIAIVLLMAGLLARLRGIIAIIIAGVLAWLAIPHLDLLIVEAYPTSFYHSPTGFSAAAIDDGADLYVAHCASCHGADGRGDGPAAKGLPVPPADLTAGHLWAHSDGEMFWWLTHGIEAPDGGPGSGMAMPGFASALSEEQRWDLIDYVRAHNAGLVHTSAYAWSPPLQRPGFTATCPEGLVVSSDDLRGKTVSIVFAGVEADAALPAAAPAGTDLKTILAALPGRRTPVDWKDCAIQDLAVGKAYAIVAGLSPDAMAGVQFLTDSHGWLRAMWRPGDPNTCIGGKGWDDPTALKAAIDRIASEPLRSSGGGHIHHH